MKRILFTIIMVCGVLYLPWWGVLSLASVGVFIFHRYWEIFFIGLLFDIVYGTQGVSLLGLGITGFLSALVVFFGVQRLKQNLR